MTRFEKILNESIPTEDLDKIIEGKRAVQRLLFDAGIKVDVKHHEDKMTIFLGDGMQVTLEVVDVQLPVEDQEDDATNQVNTIAAIAGLPEPKGVLNGTSRKLRKAKKTMANAAVKIADKFDQAAN